MIKRILLACLACSACTDDDPPPDDPRFPIFGAQARFAIRHNDPNFSESTISLLAADLEVLGSPWVSSGSTPGTPFVSGDVIVVSDLGPDRAVTLVDRFMSDVVTRISVPDGELLGQLRVKEQGTAFSPNPQDVVVLSETLAWVSRYEQNGVPEPPAGEEGTDLIAFDPSTMERLDDRIDLRRFNTTVDGAEGPVEIWARPSSLVSVSGRVLIGLDRISPDFLTYGPAALALLNPETNVPVEVPLPEPLRNCGGLAPVPGADDRVIVVCSGDFFDASTSGLVEVTVGATGTATIGRTVVAESGGLAFGRSAAPIDPDRVVAVRVDVDFTAPDELVVVDLNDGTSTPVFTAGSSFTLGGPAYDPTGEALLLVTDQDAGLTRVFERDLTAGPGGFTPVDSIDLPIAGQVPTSVTLLR